MKTVCLVGCSKEKLPHPAPAKELYCSPLFKLARQWAERYADVWAILSGKYIVLDPERVIEPYDRRFSEHRALDWRTPLRRAEWASCVQGHVQAAFCQYATRNRFPKIIVLAGREYWQCLAGRFDLATPMDGLGIGGRLQWLRQQLDRPHRKVSGELRRSRTHRGDSSPTLFDLVDRESTKR
jgi:hypothetical protein